MFDGIAYHQGSSGVKVLKGTERTPFMSVTLFDRQKCNQVGAIVIRLYVCLLNNGYLLGCQKLKPHSNAPQFKAVKPTEWVRF